MGGLNVGKAKEKFDDLAEFVCCQGEVKRLSKVNEVGAGLEAAIRDEEERARFGGIKFFAKTRTIFSNYSR